MKTPHRIMAAAALCLSLTACGGGGGGNDLSKEDQKVADNIAAYIKESSQGQLTKKDTKCFGDTFVVLDEREAAGEGQAGQGRR